MALSLSSRGKKHRGLPPKLLAANVNLGMGHLGITGGLKKTNGEYLQERYGNFWKWCLTVKFCIPPNLSWFFEGEWWESRWKNGVPYFQTNPWDQKKLVPKPMVFLHVFSFKHPEKLIRWEEPDAPGTPNSTFQLTCYGESKTNRSMDLEWKIMKPYRNLNVDWNDFQEWSEHIFSDSIIAVNIGGSGPNPMLETCRNRVGIF